MLTRLAALAGGSSPQISSISASVDTTWPALISRAASRERHFGAPIERQSSPARTSRGPSSRNLIITSGPLTFTERTVGSYLTMTQLGRKRLTGLCEGTRIGVGAPAGSAGPDGTTGAPSGRAQPDARPPKRGGCGGCGPGPGAGTSLRLGPSVTADLAVVPVPLAGGRDDGHRAGGLRTAGPREPRGGAERTPPVRFTRRVSSARRRGWLPSRR